MEAASAANWAAAMEAAGRTAPCETTSSVPSAREPASCVAASITVAAPSPALAAASVETTAPSAAAPVIPRASADKDSTGKPARPVISIRSARVRIVAVVAIITDRSRSHIARANAYADTDLRLRVSQWNHQNRQQRHIFEIPHFCYPLLQIHRLSLEAPSYLNSAARKKLRRSGWLISVILAEISHLREAGRPNPVKLRSYCR